jgi:hypothetical protein
MKRVKNLTENKDLINTFNKFKSKNHIFKSTLKKKYYFFSKFYYKSVLKACILFLREKPSKKNYFSELHIAKYHINSYKINNLLDKILFF